MKAGAARLAAIMLLLSAPVFILFLLSPHKQSSAFPGKSGKTIVSLSPSITRMLDDMGEGGKITGVTSFDNVSGRHSVGSLISPNIETVLLLKPDTVFFSEEDSAVQKIEPLKTLGIQCVSIPRSKDFNGIIHNYRMIADRTGSTVGAVKAETYRASLEKSPSKNISTVFLIAHSPIVAASSSSFIGHIVLDAGGTPAPIPSDKPFPLISKELLITLDPDCIITADPGGVPELKKMLSAFPDLTCVRKKTIFAVSAETACYYTPRDYIETKKILSQIFDTMEKPNK